ALAGWTLSGPGLAYWQERNKVNYRESAVSRGAIVAVVNSTGTLKPVQSVTVGSFVSGPVIDIYVDHNDDVQKGQLLAKIDPKIYEAAVDGMRASLATRKADVKRVEAQLQQARNNERRALALQKENANYISEQELDQYKYAKLSLDADLLVARTS